MKYYIFTEFEMVMPDQVELLRKLQEGVVGWRYREERHILDLLYDCDVKNETERLDALRSGVKVYVVLPGQRSEFHLPTKMSLLEAVADAADAVIENATGDNETEFNPAHYIVDADVLLELNVAIQKLIAFEEDT